MRAEPVSQPHAYHAEGACWSADWSAGTSPEPVAALKYVDMLAGDVLTLQDDGSVHRAPVGVVAAAIRPRARGGAVVAVERGFALASRPDLRDIEPLPEVWSDSSVRFNDGGCDPAGRFYCGTMAYGATPGAGSLYRLDPSGEATQVLTGLTISNGLGWSPDGTLAYHNDTPTRTVSVFDWTSADGLVDRRPFVRLPAELEGNPDGLTVDSEGGVWVALYGGSAVHHYSPDGTLDEVIELPVTQVTSCAFGGDDLRTLYITTSRENLDADEQPAAGGLFACTPGVAGMPVLPFAG